MKNKKKIGSILSILLVSILLIVGVTYAALSYEKEGETQELIVGDIWMKYEETNGLILDAAMPTNIENYTTYKVNPIMQEQDINELTRCVNFLNSIVVGGSENESLDYFCQGIGTFFGATFQETLDNNGFPADFLIYFEENSIILTNDDETYKVNPVMENQKITENELTRCINLYTDIVIEGGLDSGSDVESFCRRTGTLDGMVIQEYIDYMAESAKEYGYSFLYDYGGQELLDNGIIIPQIDNLRYFEFTISGKNTYTKKDIWYEIVLNHGYEHETRTTRIRDDLLRFSLVEIKDGIETTVINNRKYDDLNNKRIWVNTINKNTNEEVSITYRLYMWIDENTIIGNNREDYTLEQWEDVFASIKVNVTGDFEEKKISIPYEEMYDVTDESCFYTYEKTVYMYNNNMTSEEKEACVSYFENYELYLDEGSTIETFCDGTGTLYNGSTFNNVLAENRTFSLKELIELEEKNIIVGESGISIYGYQDDFDFCTTDVVIPRIINGKKVISIEHHDLYPFNNLTSLVMPEGILEIDYRAFYGSQLTSVEIPSTVVSINAVAFVGNQLTSIVIPDSVKNLHCEAFDEDVIITKNDDLICYFGQPE